jgi:hypothetical protein
MFNWLYQLPNIGIALLFGVIGAGLLAGVPFLREKLLRIQYTGINPRLPAMLWAW